MPSSSPKNSNYAVSIEVLIPTILTFKISAESPEKALMQVENNLWNLRPVKVPEQKRGKAKRKRAEVRSFGTTNLVLTKTY